MDLFEFDIVHRDLKLTNVLLHFPNEELTENGEDSSKSEQIELYKLLTDEKAEAKRIEFLSKVNLTQVPFEVKIADFGFSKYLNDSSSETTNTMCGTPLYMSP